MNRSLLVLIVLICSTQYLYSNSNLQDIELIKDYVGSTYTSVEMIIDRFGNEYDYSEIYVYGLIPNTKESDKLLVYDFKGLKVLYFYSEQRKKLFMYFWEITSSEYLDKIDLSHSLSYNDIILRYGDANNRLPGYLDYSLEDGSNIFFEFDESPTLLRVYWTIEW